MLYKLCEADITSYLINIFAIYLPITARWLYNEKAIKKNPVPNYSVDIIPSSSVNSYIDFILHFSVL